MSRPAHVRITAFGRLERTVELHSAATIGHDFDNDLVLDDSTVSRCHAVLLVGPAGVVLLDLGSTNGVLVNGTPARPDAAVARTDGDVIALGRVLLRYHALHAPDPEHIPDSHTVHAVASGCPSGTGTGRQRWRRDWPVAALRCGNC